MEATLFLKLQRPGLPCITEREPGGALVPFARLAWGLHGHCLPPSSQARACLSHSLDFAS